MGVVKMVKFDDIPRKVPFHDLFQTSWHGTLAVFYTENEPVLSRYLILSTTLLEYLGSRWRHELDRASGPGIQLVSVSNTLAIEWYLTRPTKPVVVSVTPRVKDKWPGDQEVVDYLDRFFKHYIP